MSEALRKNEGAPAMASFEAFWPFYLSEHTHPVNRWLHFVGTTGALGMVATAIAAANPWLLLLAPVVGYGGAWIGHFGIERNKPASFSYPLWSFRADFKMYFAMWRGQFWSGAPVPNPH